MTVHGSGRLDWTEVGAVVSDSVVSVWSDPEVFDWMCPLVSDSVHCVSDVGGIVFGASNVVNETVAEVPSNGWTGPMGTVIAAGVISVVSLVELACDSD